VAVSAARQVFTVSEYYRMAEAGILGEDDRVELIEGEIIAMSPIGSRHAACVTALDISLNWALGGMTIVRVQNPIRISEHSEPEPDIAVVRPRADLYASRHPNSADVLLIMEISETFLQYDREVKIPLYARAGIPEVWLWDLENELVLQYTRPTDGKYQEVRMVRGGEIVISSSIPNLSLSVDEILG